MRTIQETADATREMIARHPFLRTESSPARVARNRREYLAQEAASIGIMGEMEGSHSAFPIIELGDEHADIIDRLASDGGKPWIGADKGQFTTERKHGQLSDPGYRE